MRCITERRFARVIAMVAMVGLSPFFGAGCSSDSDAGGPDRAVGDGGGMDAGQVAALTPEALRDACVRASACGVKEYPSLNNCMGAYYELYRPSELAPIYDRMYRCVNGAKDCDAIANCLGRRGECDKDTLARCDGDVAISCDLIDKRIYAVNCSHAGMQCQLSSNGDALCTPGVCPADFKEGCADDVYRRCGGGLLEIDSCRSRGLLCGAVWFVEAACRGETETKCTEDELAPRCDDGKAVSCVTFREHHEDCGQHRLRKSACVDGKCVPKGQDCQEGDSNRCKGEQLEACLDGEWVAIDCARLGLGPCKPSPNAGANCS